MGRYPSRSRRARIRAADLRTRKVAIRVRLAALPQEGPARYRSRSTFCVNLEGEEVLLSTETDQYHVVNATGLAVIAEFDAGRSLEEAVEALVADTGEPADKVRRDVADVRAEHSSREDCSRRSIRLDAVTRVPWAGSSASSTPMERIRSGYVIE